MSEVNMKSIAPTFATWCAANSTQNLPVILDCYASRVPMFATFDDCLITADERQKYFTMLLTNPNLSVKVDSFTCETAGDSQIIHGDYTFSHRKGGVLNVLPARYTMVIEGGKITHHHSSQIGGTRYAEEECTMQILETIADVKIGDALSVRVGFCSLNRKQDNNDPFGITGLVYGRFTIVTKNGQELFRHISPEPSNASAQKIEEVAQKKAA